MVIESLVDFLNRIGWTLSRLQLYEKLSSRAPRLNRVLMHIFVKYLCLCLYLRDSFVKDGSVRRRWRTTLRFGTDAFVGSMTEKISEIDKLCVEAHQEAHLAVTSALVKDSMGFQKALRNLSDMEKTRQEAESKEQRLEDLKHAKRRFLKWLRHVPTEDDLHKLEKDQLEGTCEWVDDDELISSWLSLDNPSPSLLWVTGGPGTGKTVLASHIVGRLKHCHPTAYFFCKTDDQRKQTTTAVLQNWIWQLVHDSPILPESITTPSDEHQSPSTSILKKILLGLQQYLKRSYLIVDGLDECIDDVTDFLQCCRSLSQEWSVLIISRDVPSIRKGLKDGKFVHKTFTTQDNEMDIYSFLRHKAVSTQDTEEDINRFINHRTELLTMTKSWQALQETIAGVLSANAEGMFLWVRLVLDFLLEPATLESDVEDALEDMPADLNGFYDKILEKMKANPSRWKIAKKALRWIVHGFRPLTVDELHTAISFETNDQKPIKDFEEILRGSCGLLLRIDDMSKKVTMIHATVKEYLLEASDMLNTQPGGVESAHAETAVICLKYLCVTLHSGIHVDQNYQQSDQRLRNRLDSLEYCLLDYSVIHWCQHIGMSPQEWKRWQTTLHLFLSSEDFIVNWLQFFQYFYGCCRPGTLGTAEILHAALHPIPEDPSLSAILGHEKARLFQSHLGLADGKRFVRWDRFLRGNRNVPTCVPTILIAAHFNYVNTIKREIRRRISIEAKSYRGGTALLWAARGGSVDAVRYILSQKAIVNDQSTFYQETALAKCISLESHCVAYPGTYPIVPILLETGASPELKDHNQWTPLNVLINSNNSDGQGEATVVKLLLEYSLDLWRVNHDTVGSILHYAILQNKPGIMCAILEEIRAREPQNALGLLGQRFQDDNALHLALQENPHLVPVLLDQGADANALDARGVLPIQFAA